MQRRNGIEVWYQESPTDTWKMESYGFGSIDEAKEYITSLKETVPWNGYAFRVVTVALTYVIDHSE